MLSHHHHCSSLRPFRGLGVEDTVSQFSDTMTAQCDLRVEAAHLERFYANFAGVASQVSSGLPLNRHRT
jgi:aarF domain-containing kinase